MVVEKTCKSLIMLGLFMMGMNFAAAQQLKTSDSIAQIQTPFLQNTRTNSQTEVKTVLSNEEKKAVMERANAKTATKNVEDTKKDGLGKVLQTIFSEYWVQFMALIVSLIGVFLAISGFSLASKSKQKYLKKFLHEIDDAYTSYKWKSKRCEAELYRLKDLVEDQLKAGKIDENTYQLLERRIEKYLDEIKYADERPMSKLISEDQKKSNAKDLSDQIEETLGDLK